MEHYIFKILNILKHLKSVPILFLIKNLLSLIIFSNSLKFSGSKNFILPNFLIKIFLKFILLLGKFIK